MTRPPALDALPPGWSDASQTLLFADVVESVRLIQQDERRHAPRVQHLLAELVALATGRYGAELLEQRGDGLLLRWSGLDRQAVVCAAAMGRLARDLGAAERPQDAIWLRFGLHCGSVLTDGARVYGGQVNLAARVASLAQPGEVLLSQAVRDHMVPGVDGELEDLGDCWVKHASEPLRVYRLTAVGDFSAPQLPDAELARPAVAVLPFTVRGEPDVAQVATLVDLLGENLVHGLSRSDLLSVVSWFSSRAFEARSADLAGLTAQLGAHWLVTGSCVSAHGRLIVGVELHDTRSSAVVWTARVQTHAADLLCAEPEFAVEIAQGLARQICEGEAGRLARHPLPTLASHSILTGAVGLMHRSSFDSFLRSRDALEHLLDRHPRMHAVRPWLAQWYVLRNTRNFGGEGSADAARAIDQSRRAIDALPDDARAWALLGFTRYRLLQDVDGAQAHLDQALALNPNDPLALIFSATVQHSRGDSAKAAQLALGAMRRAPFDPLRDYLRGIAAGCLLAHGEPAAAVSLAEASVRENAAHPYAWRVMLIALACQGEVDRARTAMRQLDLLGHPLSLAAYRQKGAALLRPEDLDKAEHALRLVGVPEH